ncbi:MAG: SxtJ family membrane protein [Longimicrobiales bacterium]
MAQGIPVGLTAREGRRFAFTVGLAFITLAALLLWRGTTTLPAGFAMVGSALLVAGLIVPNRLGPVRRAWMALAHAISRVTTPAFMSIVYFLTIVPIGLVMRALGHDALRAPDRSGGFWVERPPEARRSDLDRQF